MKQSCRCSRITVAALPTSCFQIPPDCDYNTWVGAYAMEYGTASAWINNASYLGGFFGNLPTPGSSKGANPPSCLGSPLVFDLGDDGVEPTRAGRVTFDLLGQGRVRTAWVGVTTPCSCSTATATGESTTGPSSSARRPWWMVSRLQMASARWPPSTVPPPGVTATVCWRPET